MSKKLLIGIGIVALIGIVLVGILWKGNFDGANNVIRIGVILPLTGDRAEYGRNALEAFQVAEQIYTSKLKESRITVRFLVEDSKSTPQGAINAYQKIRIRHPDCNMVFTQGSSIAGVLSDFTSKDHIIHISNAGNAIPTKTNPYFFSCSIDEMSAAQMFNDALKDLGKCLVFYLDDDLGKTVYNEMQKLNEDKYVGIPFTHSTDSRDIVLKASCKQYAGVAVVGLGPNIVRIIRSMREFGYDGPIYGAETVLTEENKKLLSGLTNNLLCLTTTQLPIDVRNVFRKKFGREVLSISSTTSYDAAVLMISACVDSFTQTGKVSDVDQLKSIMTSKENINRAPCLKSIEHQMFKYNMEFLPL